MVSTAFPSLQITFVPLDLIGELARISLNLSLLICVFFPTCRKNKEPFRLLDKRSASKTFAFKLGEKAKPINMFLNLFESNLNC